MLAAVRRGRRIDRAVAGLGSGIQSATVRRLTEGTVRLRGRIDVALDAHVRHGLGSVEPRLLDILRLAAYEILEEPETPNYAAVSEAVDAARALLGAGPARFANAVLRNVGRTGADPSLYPDPDQDLLGYLTHWGSHPRWLVERWVESYGPSDAAALVDSNNRPAALYLRPVGLDVTQVCDALVDGGTEAHRAHPDLPNVRLGPTDDLPGLLRRFESIVQDPAATAVTEFLALAPETALDLCAAPGGKAVGLWRAGAARVLAADRSLPRLRWVRDTARRLNAPIPCVVADAAHPPCSALDAVLLDAPCTGTGTLRRHPDARWRMTPQRLGELVAVQESLLDGAARVTRRGGLLVYSTCSLEPEENLGQVNRFLSRRPDFSLEVEERVPPEFRDPHGNLQVLPHRSGFDGAFAARLRRA